MCKEIILILHYNIFPKGSIDSALTINSFPKGEKNYEIYERNFR